MISPSCSWEFIREAVIFDSWTNLMGQIFSMNPIHKTNKSDWSGSRVQLNDLQQLTRGKYAFGLFFTIQFFDYLTIWFRKTLRSMLYGPHLWYLYGALASFSKLESLSSHTKSQWKEKQAKFSFCLPQMNMRVSKNNTIFIIDWTIPTISSLNYMHNVLIR